MQRGAQRKRGLALAQRNAEVRRLWRETPMTKREIADMFGITHQWVSQITKGEKKLSTD